VARSAKAARTAGGDASATKPEKEPLRQHALPDLDRLIHERVRLGVVSALAANDTLPFVELKRVVGTSDGNLSVHARKLEQGGYVACTKSFAGRTPRTEFRLTAQGRRAFERFLEHLAALIRHARGR
jgi:DNA-binding HxlR family transcriptional regulator